MHMNQSTMSVGASNAHPSFSGVNSPAAAAAALASAVVFLQPSLGSEYNVPESIDLEGLLRVPWHIEVKLTSGVNEKPGMQSTAGAAQSAQQNSAAVEYLKVDSYLGKYTMLLVHLTMHDWIPSNHSKSIVPHTM
jgi:hypothetical protein